jgi:hypothetical protein
MRNCQRYWRDAGFFYLSDELMGILGSKDYSSQHGVVTP